MTPDVPNNPRSELEARLTALLLGELPADEAADLRERIAQDVELAKLHAQLEHTIELVRETAATPADESADQPAPLRLSGDRREKLLARFKTVAPKEFAKTKKRKVSWMVPMAAAAVFVALASLVLYMSQEQFMLSERISVAEGTQMPAKHFGFNNFFNLSRERRSVTTTIDQSDARPAADLALRRAKSEVAVQYKTDQGVGAVTFGGQFRKSAARPESEGRDREALSGDSLADGSRGKTVANNIILPPSTELVAVSPAPTPTPERHGFALLGPIQNPDQEANSPAMSGPDLAWNDSKEGSARGAITTTANQGEATKNPAGAFPEIADLNAFGLKPSIAPSTRAEPPTPSLPAHADLAKELPAKPATVAGNAPNSSGLAGGYNRLFSVPQTPEVIAAAQAHERELSSEETDQMSRRFYRLAPGGTGGSGGGGGAPVPALKSEISDLPSAPAVAATTPSTSPAPAAAGDFFFITGTTRDDVAALRQLTPGQPAAAPEVAKDENLVPLEIKLPQPAFKGTPKNVPLAAEPEIVEREKLAESDKNRLIWGAYDPGTKAPQIFPAESVAAGFPVTASPPPNIDPATGLPEPLAAPVAPEVSIKARFADVAQADQKQAAGFADSKLDEEIKAGVASASTQIAGGLGGQATGGGRFSGIRSPAGTRERGASVAGLANTPPPPTPGAVFLGYDDPGQFVPQAQVAANSSIGVPLVAQLPVPHWRVDGKDYHGEPPPGTTLPKDKAAFLGDLPLVGRLFRSDPNATGGGVVAGKPATDGDSDVKLSLADGLNQNLTLNKSAGSTLALNGANDFSGGAATANSFVNSGTMNSGRTEADKLSTLSGNVDTSGKWNYEAGNGNLQFPVTVTNAAVTLPLYNLNIVGYANVPDQRKPGEELKKAQEQTDDRLQVNGQLASPALTADTLRHIEGTRIESESEFTRQETMVDLLRKAQKEQGNEKLAQAIQTTAPDAQLGSLLEQQNAAKQRAAIAEKEFGPSHPEVAKAKVQAEALRKKVEGRSDQVIAAMDAKVASLKDGVAKLDKEVSELTAKDATTADNTKPYWEAKRQLEELQGFQKILKMKLAAENTDITLPKSAMVEIVDNAKPPPPKAPSLWERLGGAKAGEVASTARVKVEREQNDIQGMATPGMLGGYDPHFVQTEFEALQSDAVLGKVVNDLKLDEKWAKKGAAEGKLKREEAIAQLKKKLDLHPVRNTSLMEIKAKSDNPEEAAQIANTVAKEYQDLRQKQWNQRTRSGVQVLEGRFQEQEQKLREAKEKVEKLGAELKIAEATAAQPAARTATKEPEPPKQSRPKAPVAEPQPEVQTCDNSFSTFSLNISDVSFKLALASLEKGQMPDAGSVRSEEFINAFDYRDPDPPPGAPIGYAFERARYPFAQNRDLIRFSLKTAALGRQAGRPLNLVLLLDNSGSMERADRVRIIHEALRVLAGQLQPKDKLSVITFARTARLVADGVSGSEAGKLVEEVSGLTPEGGTNLEEAMNTAYATALRHYLADGINRVVLLTDGAANLGNVEPEALKQKVEAHRKQGVALDCFGIGWEGYNDDLLEVLSRNGDGRYGFINSPEEAATEFAGQLAGALHVAASDVKVQIEFNPKRVVAYRQIGYAKHQLTKQQFRDNTVDAAEIAAQEAGNALYVVEVNPRGEGPVGTVRVRYKVPGTSEYHEHEWEAPYTGNAVELEQASPAMRLAATASTFSEWLVSSPFAGEVSPDSMLGYLSGVPEVYGADGRPKKLEWAIRQAKSLVGK